jgi:hypothetical protein
VGYLDTSMGIVMTLVFDVAYRSGEMEGQKEFCLWVLLENVYCGRNKCVAKIPLSTVALERVHCVCY